MAAFLRTANKLSLEQLEEITDQMKKQIVKGSNDDSKIQGKK